MFIFMFEILQRFELVWIDAFDGFNMFSHTTVGCLVVCSCKRVLKETISISKNDQISEMFTFHSKTDIWLIFDGFVVMFL